MNRLGPEMIQRGKADLFVPKSGEGSDKGTAWARLRTTTGIVAGGMLPKALIGTWEVQTGTKASRHNGAPLPVFALRLKPPDKVLKIEGKTLA